MISPAIAVAVGGDRAVDECAHDVAAARQEDQRDEGERDAERQRHLGDDQDRGGRQAGGQHGQRGEHRQPAATSQGDAAADEPLIPWFGTVGAQLRSAPEYVDCTRVARPRAGARAPFRGAVDRLKRRPRPVAQRPAHRPGSTRGASGGARRSRMNPRTTSEPVPRASDDRRGLPARSRGGTSQPAPWAATPDGAAGGPSRETSVALKLLHGDALRCSPGTGERRTRPPCCVPRSSPSPRSVPCRGRAAPRTR